MRFAVDDLHHESNQPVGIFHAVRYLRDDGLLTGEQEATANDVFDWLSDHLDAPRKGVLEANPQAVSWFEQRPQLTSLRPSGSYRSSRITDTEW